MPGLFLFGVILILVVSLLFASVKMIPQGEAAVVERLGRYTRTVSGGLTLLVPYIDRIRARVDALTVASSSESPVPPEVSNTAGCWASAPRTAPAISASGTTSASGVSKPMRRKNSTATGPDLSSYLPAAARVEATITRAVFIVQPTLQGEITRGRPSPARLREAWRQPGFGSNSRPGLPG